MMQSLHIDMNMYKEIDDDDDDDIISKPLVS
jgi:hypothetical protein